MTFGRTVVSAGALLGVGSILHARPLDCNESAWLADPIVVASLRADAAAGGISPEGDVLALHGHPRSSDIVVSARISPCALGEASNRWSVAGVLLADDACNFWQLALVRPPEGSRLEPFFELEEMRDGIWNSAERDGLRRIRLERNGSWRDGESYRLRIGIRNGEVRGDATAADGHCLYRATFALDDRPAVRAGRPAIRTSRGLTGRFAELDCTAQDELPEKRKEILEFPPYCPVGQPDLGRGRATGFFHVEEDGDGRWWAVDPIGSRIFVRGVEQIKWKAFPSGPRGESRNFAVNREKYGTRQVWERATLKRLADWGFNALGCGCDPELAYRGLVHTKYLNLGGRLAHANDRLAIRFNPHSNPCEGFPNVFDPLWERMCDHVAKEDCAAVRDDPWLVGYFLDNELTWWGKVWDNDGGTGLFDLTLALPPEHTARQALVAFLSERGYNPSSGVPAEVKVDFLRLAAERYFSVATAAVRKADPNHLILGCRFATLGGGHRVVWETAGKYCDAVSCNIYPTMDFSRGLVLMDEKPDAPTLAAAIRTRFAWSRKPMLVTEWSFPALDAGLPCKHGAGQRVATQAERTRATEQCARTFLALGSVIGYDYFMWVDEPAEGISAAFPEDSNYGLLSAEDVPYPIAETFARLHRAVGELRRAPVPGEEEETR